MDISWETAFKIITAFILSVGGSGTVIVALAKWFGDILAQKLLVQYTHKHNKQLEDLKSRYSKDLETTKNDLEKARSQFFRYTEKQFDIYNGLWKVLHMTKKQADALWEDPDPKKITSFAEQIRATRDAIENEFILINEDDYDKLEKLIEEFENFIFGKVRLVDIMRGKIKNSNRYAISTKDVKLAIANNKSTKDNYDKLIVEVGKNFRERIGG